MPQMDTYDLVFIEPIRSLALARSDETREEVLADEVALLQCQGLQFGGDERLRGADQGGGGAFESVEPGTSIPMRKTGI